MEKILMRGKRGIGKSHVLQLGPKQVPFDQQAPPPMNSIANFFVSLKSIHIEYGSPLPHLASGIVTLCQSLKYLLLLAKDEIEMKEIMITKIIDRKVLLA